VKPIYRLDEDGAGQVEVNMSPLIDCVFLLLIFFIVTTVFVEETGVDVNKPQAASARDLEKNSLMFALTADGSIVYGGRKIGLNSVRGIVVRQSLVELIDECKMGGATQVSIAARKETGS